METEILAHPTTAVLDLPTLFRHSESIVNQFFSRTVTFLLLSIATVLAAPINVLLITVDDMSCDSVGVYGNPITNITPNIDQLASEGLRFKHGHVTVAICHGHVQSTQQRVQAMGRVAR